MTDAVRSISGSVAIVTGAASGMGRATARLFAAQGAHVAAIDSSAEGLATLVAEVGELGKALRAWTVDLREPAAIATAVSEIAAVFGAIDIVVNNAGVLGFKALDDEGYDALWDRVIDVNLTALQRVVRAALPHLRRAAAPRIVNIASTEGLGATPNNTAYIASKTGVVGLTRGMALDLGRDGITVNCICPGFIATPMTDFVDEEGRAKFAHARTALRRPGTPEEVAHVTLGLCLPASSYVTGAIIPVDGGLVMRNA